MDTSKEYIKMCDKAKEMQEMWDLKVGDWFINKQYAHLPQNVHLVGWYYRDNIKGVHSTATQRHYKKDEVTWLPRQDQLQKMCNKIKPVDWYNGDWTCWDNLLDKPWWGDTYLTGEQLWLAFTMKEKYNKIWNGKDWVKPQ